MLKRVLSYHKICEETPDFISECIAEDNKTFVTKLEPYAKVTPRVLKEFREDEFIYLT